MESLAKEYKGKAEFVFVYTREAHPEGDRRNVKTKDGKAIPQATTEAERKEMAEKFCDDMKSSRLILVDSFGRDSAQQLYGGLPNPTVVIGVDGKIALKMAWTNGKALGDFLKPFIAQGGKYNAELAKKVPLTGPMMPRK